MLRTASHEAGGVLGVHVTQPWISPHPQCIMVPVMTVKTTLSGVFIILIKKEYIEYEVQDFGF